MGLGLPLRLALGAASGTPAARITARATGWLGIRTATVSMPPVVVSGTRSERGSTIVSGPGQKASARIFAFSGMAAATSGRAERSAMWAIMGLSPGRPLAAYTAFTAASS